MRSVKLLPIMEECLLAFASCANALMHDYFVIGATARDIVMTHLHGIKIARATADLDIGIALRDWSAHEVLGNKLVQDYGFRRTKYLQSFVFKTLQVDVVPFGGLERPTGKVTWPDQNSLAMTISGFDAAFKNSLAISIRSQSINVMDLTGLVVLKLISWQDRPAERQRDAQDIAFVLESYFDAGNEDRVIDEHNDLYSMPDFSIQKAGATLLGRDIKAKYPAKILAQIGHVLIPTTEINMRLAHAMISREADLKATTDLLRCLCAGLGRAGL